MSWYQTSKKPSSQSDRHVLQRRSGDPGGHVCFKSTSGKFCGDVSFSALDFPQKNPCFVSKLDTEIQVLNELLREDGAVGPEAPWARKKD